MQPAASHQPAKAHKAHTAHTAGGAGTVPTQSVVFQGVSIDIPTIWVVEHTTSCPARPPGTLLLDQHTPPVEYCPMIPAARPSVAIEPLIPEPRPTPSRTLTLGGLRVDQYGDATGGTWVLPTLSLQVEGSGPGARSVMETLRPA